MWPITHILWLTYSFWCSSLKRTAIYSLELSKSFKLFTIGCGNSPRFISAWLMLDCFWNKLTLIKQNLSKHSHYLTRSSCKLSELVPEWAPLVLIVGLLSGHKNKTECEVEMKIKLNMQWLMRASLRSNSSSQCVLPLAPSGAFQQHPCNVLPSFDMDFPLRWPGNSWKKVGGDGKVVTWKERKRGAETNSWDLICGWSATISSVVHWPSGQASVASQFSNGGDILATESQLI